VDRAQVRGSDGECRTVFAQERDEGEKDGAVDPVAFPKREHPLIQENQV
jgi:hypothetical protein